MPSWEAVEWAIRQDLQPATKLVLVAIARRANADREAWPSQTTLARECGVSVSAVKRHLHALVSAGLLARDIRPRAHKRNDPNLYRLAAPEAAALPSTNGRVEGSTGDTHSARAGAALPFSGGPHSRSPVGGYSRSPVNPEPVTPEPAMGTPPPAPPPRARERLGWADFRERIAALRGLELDAEGEGLLAAAADVFPLLDLRAEAVGVAAYAKGRPRETWSLDRVRRWLEGSERRRKEEHERGPTGRRDGGGDAAGAGDAGRRRAGQVGAGVYAGYSVPSDAPG